MMKISISIEKPLSLRKVSPRWYRIAIAKDSWDIDVTVVDVVKTKLNDWSVCPGIDLDGGELASDKRRYVFEKLRTAKVFALDLAEAIKHEKPYPSIIDQKYLDLN